MTVHVTTLASCIPVPKEFIVQLQEVVQAILDRQGLPSGEVGIILAGDDQLRDLNYSYRGLDSPTDVLSFGMLDQQEESQAFEQGRDILVGDIYISLDKAREQAAEASHPFLQEVVQLAIHGLLHLLGFSHDECNSSRVMAEREWEFFSQLASKIRWEQYHEPDGQEL